MVIPVLLSLGRAAAARRVDGSVVVSIVSLRGAI
jgi:hypothetical protein